MEGKEAGWGGGRGSAMLSQQRSWLTMQKARMAFQSCPKLCEESILYTSMLTSYWRRTAPGREHDLGQGDFLQVK